MTYEKYLKLSSLFRVLLIIGLILVQTFLSTLFVTEVIIPWISSFDKVGLEEAFDFGMIYSVLLIIVCMGIDFLVLGLYRKHTDKKESKLLNKELGRI